MHIRYRNSMCSNSLPLPMNCFRDGCKMSANSVQDGCILDKEMLCARIHYPYPCIASSIPSGRRLLFLIPIIFLTFSSIFKSSVVLRGLKIGSPVTQNPPKTMISSKVIIASSHGKMELVEGHHFFTMPKTDHGFF